MSIARTSGAVLSFLRERLTPLIPAERVVLCSPQDKGEALLGVYLADVCVDKRFRVDRRIAEDEKTFAPPPLCLSLTYMVTSYAGQPDDHLLLEHVLQLWHDEPTLKPLSRLQPDTVPNTKAELAELDIDTKSKIWQFPGVPYYISLFYRVAPVVIESSKRIHIDRVKAPEFDIKRKEV